MVGSGTMTATRSLALVLLFVSAGCPQPTPEERPERSVVDAPVNESLAASLNAEVVGDTVNLALRVTNPTDEAVELTFPSGQSFDFVVTRQGRELWRWSEDRMFTQAIRYERIEPGETRVYESAWVPPPGVEGELAVRGFLTARDQRLEQETRIRLP
jgi:hypothetical protein